MDIDLDKLDGWLKKQKEDDWSDGDPRAKASKVIEIDGNIDYDPENAFWLASMRQRERKKSASEE